jgi:hypothetical protein
MKMALFQNLGRRRYYQAAIVAGVSLATTASLQSEPRTRVTPYLEFQQVLSADFNGGETLTYSGIGAGIDASVATRRVQATIAYNYQHRIGWGSKLEDADVHSGLAAIHVEAMPGVLSFDAGAMAARSHADIRFPSAGLRTIDDPNVAEVYSGYAGPTLNTHAGPVKIGAAYRLGYVHVDDHSVAGGAVPPGTRRVERYSSSTVHNASVSAGMGPGQLPFGWTVGAGWSREDMNRLDSTFEGKYVRGDIVVPVSAHLAVTGGLGYEDMTGSQQDILRGADGLPVTGPGGQLIADPSKPRLLTYDQSGLIWDAGVIWRPNPRSELQARIGRRYGGTTFTGSLQHRLSSNASINVSVYDSVDSFGRLLVSDLAGVPRRFELPRNPFDPGVGGTGGCVFGSEPGTGACFDDALQSISNFNFRNRGVSARFSGGRGPWGYGVGASFNQRRYFAPPAGDFVLDGVTDESFTLNGQISRQLSRNSGYGVDAFAGWFDSGIAGSDAAFSGGLTGNYYRTILDPRLQATIAAGLYTASSAGQDQTVGSILFGLRFSF